MEQKLTVVAIFLTVGLAALFLVNSFTGYVAASSRLTVDADLFAGDGDGISANCAVAKQNNGVDQPSDYDLTDGNDWMLLCLKTSARANCVVESIEDKWIVGGYDRMQVASKKMFNASFGTDGTAGYQYRVKFRNNPSRGEYNLITAFNRLMDYDTINIKCTPTNGGAAVKVAKTRTNKHGFLELFCNPGLGQGDCNWVSPNAQAHSNAGTTSNSNNPSNSQSSAQAEYITNECYGQCNSCPTGYAFVTAWTDAYGHMYQSCRHR